MDVWFRTHAVRVEIPRSVWISSFWLRLGLVGALLAAYAVAVVASDGAMTATAAAIFVAGAGLTLVGFRHSRRALDRGGAHAPCAAAHADARRAGLTGGAA